MASVESELASLQRVQDRVQSAKSEDLPVILAALIPKLVALANQDPLRTKTISVLSECMKRLRLAKIPIDLSGILGSIHPRMLPFAANLAVSFVNVAIEFGVSKTSQKEAVIAVLDGLSEFAPFSSQSNALCYYATEYLTVGLAAHASSVDATIDNKAYKQAQNVLGDFAIDIAMLQRPLVISNEQSAVGSVQAGLSASRVDRLTCKKKAWTAADLKATKLQLINLIPTGIFLPQHAAFISIVLSNDVDAEVATQAAFKMNGCTNMLRIDKDPVVAAEVVVSLLSYCSQPAAKPNAPVVVNTHKRSLARADVRLSTLRWLARHLSSHLTSSAKAIVTQLFQCVFAPIGGAGASSNGATGGVAVAVATEATSVASALTEEVAVIAASLQLLQALLERCEASLLTDKVMLILLCVKRVLQSFAYSTTSFAAGEHHVAVRLSSYCIIEEIANKFRALRKQVTEAQVNAMALKVSASYEEEQTEGMPNGSGDIANTDTTAALAIAATAKVESDALVMYGKVTIEDAAMLLLLFQLLDREHAQRNESSILALYRAMNSLREAYILVQQTPALVGALSSAVPAITGGLSADQSSKLQDLLRSVRRPDKDAKMRLAALQWSAALFKHDRFVIETAYLLADDTSESVVTAAVAEFTRLRVYLQETITTTNNNDGTPALSGFLPALLAVLTLIVDTPEVMQIAARDSDGESKSSITGLHYLLDTAALGLRLLHGQFNAQERNSVLLPHVPLLARVVKIVATIPLLRPSNVTLFGVLSERTQDAYFTSQRAAQVAKASTAAPEVENVHHANANNTSNNNAERVSVGTASTAGKLSAGRVTETINAHLLRSVSSVTYSLLQLCGSVDVSSERNSTAGDNPSSKAIVLTVAKECIPQYLTWLALAEQDVRSELASIFATLCSDDANIASNLVRQLTHKLAVLHSLSAHHHSGNGTGASASIAAVPAVEASGANLKAAAGALRSLGSIVAHIALSNNKKNEDNQIKAGLTLSEAQHTMDQLLSHIAECLQLDGTVRTELCLLQVVALEVLHQLTSDGLVVKERAREKIALLVSEEVMHRVVKLLHQRDYRIAVPAIHVFSILSTTNTNITATDKAAPLAEMLTCWAELMTSTLRGNEHHCVKFAWAEAMVHLSAQPWTHSREELLSAVIALGAISSTGGVSSACVALSKYLSDSPVTLAPDANMPVMLQHLLHLIDQASNSTATAANTSERSTYCVALLVLVKSSAPGNSFPAVIVRKIVEVFLRFLRDKDLFVQDICCMGLCHLYNASGSAGKEVTGLTGPAGQPVSVSEYVAYEVMVTLMRERRTVQPVGYSAGSSSTSAGTAQAQARERAAAQPVNPTPDTGAVAGGGGGGNAAPAQDNHLMQAAVAAAAELGVGLQFGSGGEELGTQHQQSDQLPQDYVVYATICKMAKQAKDSSILFAVLALIKRDPTFGTGPSRNLAVEYAAPAVQLSSSKLIEMLPLLYHARFDPNTTVRPVMRALWETLMDTHFPQAAHLQLDLVQHRVVAFLVSKLSSPAWRDREAACLALEAFLPRRAWAVSAFPLLEELFHSALRALDDMRDSTRGAALSYTKALSSHIVRACNSEQSPEPMVTSAVDKIVPLLLEKGLVAPSAEARGVSLGLLGKVVEAAKSAPALRKWLARIISVLVEGMSALEPQTLQYMQFHTARLRISDEELESMRIKMAQSSPLQEALEICLTSLHQATAYNTNATTIPEVVQGLSQQLQRGVGLATRVAAAQSLSQLAERYAVFLGKGSSGVKPAAEAFQCIIWSLTQAPHMAVTLKKAMTSAFGALCKVVDEEVLASECEQLVRKYSALQRDQLDQSLVLAQCIQQIVQRGGSRLEDGVDNRQELWDHLLSCAYLGSHDSDAESKAVWTATWQETLSASGVGTKLSALMRILPQLLTMVHAVYKELSWHRRLQAVQVLREILDVLPADALAAQLDQVSEQFTSLLTTLLTSVPGQVWAGQAAVLEVVSELMSRCKSHVSLCPLHLSASAHGKAPVDSNLVIPVLQVGDRITTFAELTGGLLGKHMAEKIESDCAGMTVSDHLTSSAPKSSSSWSLSFFGWALLLVHESRRGARNNTSVTEAEYRQSAARALSLLPWSLLAASPEGTTTFAQLLPLLCRQGGIPPYAPAALLPAEGGLTGNSAEGAVKADSRPNKRLLGNAALFGVRYRQFNDGTAARKAPAAVVTVEAASEVGEGVEEESNIMIVEGSESDLEDTMGVEEEAKETEPLQELTSMVVTSTEDIEAPVSDEAAVVAEEGGSTAAQVYVSYEHKHPPVYHIYYLECLLRGWPKDPSVSNNTSVDSLLKECLQHILVWAQHCMHTAVWSVRKAAVQLVGAVCSARLVLDTQCENALLIVELALNEQKFIKVRVEALKSLALLLQSANRVTIDSNESLKSRVRDLIRNASTDSQPTILEAVSKVQNLWLS